MPTFEKCDRSIKQLADLLIASYETHEPLRNHDVTIDFVFAYSDKDEKTGARKNDALTHHGHRAYGITRVVPLKDRALGRSDAEIALDGDWWKEATEAQQKALLDHELHHIAVKEDRHGHAAFDDLDRPMLRMRKHDVEIGWFTIIAARHGADSLECRQAAVIMDAVGQYFWPSIAPLIPKQVGEPTKPVDAFAKSSATPA